MMIKTAMQMRDAAFATRPGYLIDKFLDWVEQLSSTIPSAQLDRLALIEIRTERVRDR
ncbi:MAG TPA: hypothetical protein VFB02_18825 [Bradyrhizobium sp.]|nr:hypothetical protein [Bradyrhizobium sp.]